MRRSWSVELTTAEEVLITDSRAGLTPAQMVEAKLQSLLNQ
jgi:hypothetical protein